jgi:hypothetical protein
MLDEGNDLNVMETPDAPPPEEKSNRTFWIVGGIMAGLVFLTLICMAVYFLVISPRATAQRTSAQATIEAGNIQVAQQLTLTAQAAQATSTVQPTPLPIKTGTPVPRTPVSSPTPVIALPQNSPVATVTLDQVALAAQQTQLAYQLTSTNFVAQGTPGYNDQGLPTTGFFDDLGGLPTMILLTFALVVVILLARRMRKAPTK